MKKILISLFVVFCVTTVSKAQESEIANSLLWKITAPDGETSYLFGTYHLAGADFLNEKTRVKRIFETSEKLVVETVIDSAQILILSTKYMMMPDVSLEELLDSSDYHLLKTEFNEAGIPDLSPYNHLKPMVLSAIYTVSMAKKITPDERNYGGLPLDIYLTSEAAKNRKEVVALETMEEQLQTLYSTETVESQANDLIKMVKAAGETVDQTLEVIEAYYKEDLNAMLKISEDMEAGYGDMDHLLKERNEKWIKSLSPLLKEGGVFIAVGALHLPGEDGLIKLLEKENFILSPVMPVSED